MFVKRSRDRALFGAIEPAAEVSVSHTGDANCDPGASLAAFVLWRISVRPISFMSTSTSAPSFFARLGLAFRVLGNASLAQQVAALETPAEPPPEKVHAAGLAVLALLQREGRLVDFLQEDVASFSDAEIGAAARVVHEGSRKVLRQYVTLEPVLADAEGATVTVPAGFDAERIRLTGNVAGQPPFRGSLRHHGWVATTVKFPALSPAFDPRVIAPAEVEL
jgi:hypothetical protein